MKICFLTREVFSIGGVQRVVSVLANQLSQYHEIDIICNTKEFKEDREMYNLNDNINIIFGDDISFDYDENKLMKLKRFCIRKINLTFGIFNDEKWINMMKDTYYPEHERNRWIKYINSRKYDVVIGVEGYFSVLLGIISEEIDSKVLGWQHNSYDAYFNNKNMYYYNEDILFEKFIPKLDDYIVLTNDDKLKIKNYMNINSTVVYNPLSFSSKVKSDMNNKAILSVGRLVEAKGFDLLIEAYSMIYKQIPEWKLIIVGDGPLRESLIHLVEAKGLTEYVILEKGTQDIIGKYLDASIFVSASRWEGFGLTITEAMECGLPVISFSNTGPKEIINKNRKNGILVKNDDVAELSREILNLANNETIRNKISSESIKRADEFNVENIAQIWDFIIKK